MKSKYELFMDFDLDFVIIDPSLLGGKIKGFGGMWRTDDPRKSYVTSYRSKSLLYGEPIEFTKAGNLSGEDILDLFNIELDGDCAYRMVLSEEQVEFIKDMKKAKAL